MTKNSYYRIIFRCIKKKVYNYYNAYIRIKILSSSRFVFRLVYYTAVEGNNGPTFKIEAVL